MTGRNNWEERLAKAKDFADSTKKPESDDTDAVSDDFELVDYDFGDELEVDEGPILLEGIRSKERPSVKDVRDALRKSRETDN